MHVLRTYPLAVELIDVQAILCQSSQNVNEKLQCNYMAIDIT